MGALIDTTSENSLGMSIKCDGVANWDDNPDNPSIDLKLTIYRDQNNKLAEIDVKGTASNPIIITATTLYAVGSYALCIGFSIVSSVYGVAEKAYRESKEERPSLATVDHLKNGFDALNANKDLLNADARRSIIRCAEKLIPIPHDKT